MSSVSCECSTTNSITNLLGCDGNFVDKDSLSDWLVDDSWAFCWYSNKDGFFDIFFVLNFAKLVDGEEVVSGLGDLVMFNSEVFLGDILGSLIELIESISSISVDDVESSSILGSAGGGSVVAGGLESLWSVLNIGNKEIALLGHSSWSVVSISSGLSGVESLLSVLNVVDLLGG